METSASIHPTRVPSNYTTWLAWLLAAVLVVAAFVMPVVDKSNNQLAGDVMNVIGAILIVAGLYVFSRSPWMAVALVAVGAVVGSLPILQLVIPPIAVVVLIVLIVRDARRSPTA